MPCPTLSSMGLSVGHISCDRHKLFSHSPWPWATRCFQWWGTCEMSCAASQANTGPAAWPWINPACLLSPRESPYHQPPCCTSAGGNPCRIMQTFLSLALLLVRAYLSASPCPPLQSRYPHPSLSRGSPLFWEHHPSCRDQVYFFSSYRLVSGEVTLHAQIKSQMSASYWAWAGWWPSETRSWPWWRTVCQVPKQTHVKTVCC